jgi:hypothetical protein
MAGIQEHTHGLQQVSPEDSQRIRRMDEMGHDHKYLHKGHTLVHTPVGTVHKQPVHTAHK